MKNLSRIPNTNLLKDKNQTATRRKTNDVNDAIMLCPISECLGTSDNLFLKYKNAVFYCEQEKECIINVRMGCKISPLLSSVVITRQVL